MMNFHSHSTHAQEWDLYSDVAHRASMSVVINKKVKNFKTVYVSVVCPKV